MNSKREQSIKPSATILVLEDEPLVRLMICSGLEQAGFMVCEAGTCTDALQAVRNTHIDAAVFDYRLPDGNGLDVVQQLEESGRHLPVVMLSGESIEITERSAIYRSISAVLPKPPDVDAVVEAVSQSMGCVKAAAAENFGRYLFWHPEENTENVEQQMLVADWLAIEMDGMKGNTLSTELLRCIELPRIGLAIVGASPTLRENLTVRGISADFVADTEELAALSRRPSTFMERESLLAAVQLF